MICTDEGAHALLLCADGGVVYYHAPVEAAARASGDSTKEGGEEEDASGGGGSSSSNSSMRGSGAGSLVELSCLFRQKDLQQHTGSWALRRVGHQGLVVRLAKVQHNLRDLVYFLAFSGIIGVAESVP